MEVYKIAKSRYSEKLSQLALGHLGGCRGLGDADDKWYS